MRVPDPNFFGGVVEMSERGGDWTPHDSGDLPLGAINWPADAPRFANHRALGVAEMAAALRDGRPQPRQRPAGAACAGGDGGDRQRRRRRSGRPRRRDGAAAGAGGPGRREALRVVTAARLVLDDDRLFPADPATRAIARSLYEEVAGLPILSPHGHTDPRWYAEDAPFPDPATLFVIPDHYVFRMLYSQGIGLEELGIAPKGEAARRFRPARRLAHLRRELLPLPRHADAHLARPRLRDALRLHRAAFGGDRRRLLRHDRRSAGDAGIPPARALQALQHRGDRHHRQPARSAHAP